MAGQPPTASREGAAEQCRCLTAAPPAHGSLASWQECSGQPSCTPNLDEVTSAPGPETGQAIVGNIRALRGKSTIIAITHRAAFLEIADRIYELAEGRALKGRAN